MAGQLELEKQVGRLIIGRLPGTDLPDEYEHALQSGIIGGITFFKENAETLEQLAGLVGAVIEASYHVPVLAVDQEGGAVQRFDRVLTPLPSAMALAACGNWDYLEQVSRLSARQLKALGLNCLLAPVLDVITNPHNQIVSTRAFGNQPANVAIAGRIVAEAIREEGLLPVGKHFPGHGATREDSHVALAVNKLPIEEIWKRDLYPYKSILEKSNLPIILIGHIWVPEIEEKPVPASLSSRITQSILREYLGFKGLVMTDDMIMNGITNSYGLGEACVMAVEAGADLLLVCGSLKETMEAHAAIVQAIKSGRITEKRLSQSLARIKKHFLKKPKSACPVRQPKKFVGLKKLLSQDAPVCYDASLNGIAITRGGIPDLRGHKWTILVPEHPRYSLSNFYMYLCERFAVPSKGTGGKTQFVIKRYPLEPSFEDATAISESLAGENCIYLTFRALLHEDQLRLGQMVADVCREKVAVLTDNPFDVAGLPDWPNIVATHDPSEQAMKALAQVFFEQRAHGVSPVKLDLVPA